MDRNYTYKLNAFENGWLNGDFLGKTRDRAKKEVPGLWLQLELNFAKVYADSEGHAYQKQAKKDVVKYQKMLDKLLDKEEKEYGK